MGLSSLKPRTPAGGSNKENTVSDKDFNPFALSSGLPLADADVTVKGIEFGFDAQYMNGDACVAIVKFEGEDGEEHSQFYSVGKFEAADRGERLVHPSGKQMNLNQQSNYGRFVDALTSMDNASEFMAAVRESGVDAVFDAHWLDGFQFHLSTMKVKMQDGKERDLIVPDHFLGVADTGKSKGKSAIKSAGPKLAPKGGAAKASAKAAPADDDEDYGIDDDEIRNALIELAKESADFDTYSEAALDVDGVLGNKAYQKAAVSSRAGSIWATFGDS
jgi:hypothetical protein